MKDVTVLIIDEHSEVCARLARALSAIHGLRVVAHTGNPVWAAEFARYWSPQIILADFKLGPRPRPEAVAWLKKISPASQIVVHASYYVNGERDSFQLAGATECLLKGLSSFELGRELRRVALEGTAERVATTSKG
jgi:DNA-binding NarL/FixJ family response regulator